MKQKQRLCDSLWKNQTKKRQVVCFHLLDSKEFYTFHTSFFQTHLPEGFTPSWNSLVYLFLFPVLFHQVYYTFRGFFLGVSGYKSAKAIQSTQSRAKNWQQMSTNPASSGYICCDGISPLQITRLEPMPLLCSCPQPGWSPEMAADKCMTEC